MSEMEDLMKRIQEFPDPTLLVFTFPSWQAAGDAIMELSFAVKELGQAMGAKRASIQLNNPGSSLASNVSNGGGSLLAE